MDAHEHEWNTLNLIIFKLLHMIKPTTVMWIKLAKGQTMQPYWLSQLQWMLEKGKNILILLIWQVSWKIWIYRYRKAAFRCIACFADSKKIFFFFFFFFSVIYFIFGLYFTVCSCSSPSHVVLPGLYSNWMFILVYGWTKKWNSE